MWNMIRTASMLAFLLGACAMSARLGCSSGDNSPKPPKGAPENEVNAPTVETPAEQPAAEKEEAVKEAESDEKAAEDKEMPAEEEPSKSAPTTEESLVEKT